MAGMAPEQVLRLFAQEADVRLTQIGQLLLQLEQTSDTATLVPSIFREIHTLKGSSAVAGLDEVSQIAHRLEQLVDDLRTGRREITSDVIDTLLNGADELAASISVAQIGSTAHKTPSVAPRTAAPPQFLHQPDGRSVQPPPITGVAPQPNSAADPRPGSANGCGV